MDRTELNGTWWRFEVKPSQQEIDAFVNMYRPDFIDWLKNFFKPHVKANRVWSEMYPDISFYFDSIDKAWYREFHRG